jgi:hypothetical protein
MALHVLSFRGLFLAFPSLRGLRYRLSALANYGAARIQGPDYPGTDSSVVQGIVTLYSRVEGLVDGERLLGEAQDSDPKEVEWLLPSQRMDQVVVFGDALLVTELVSELLKKMGVLNQDPSHAKVLLKTFQEDRKKYQEDTEILTRAEDLLEPLL